MTIVHVDWLVAQSLNSNVALNGVVMLATLLRVFAAKVTRLRNPI